MSVYGNGSPVGPPTPAPVASVNFDYISKAWELVRERLGTWVVATLIGFGIAFIVAIGGAIYQVVMTSGVNANPNQRDIGALLGVVVVRFLSSIVSGLLTSFFLGGFYRMAFKQLRGQPTEVSDIFSGKDVFLPIFGANLLMGFATGIGSLFCLLPGLLLAGLWMFTIPLIVDKGLGVFEAMGKSFEALRPHMWSALGYYFVLAIVASLGFLLCGLGWLVTIPLLYIGVARLYLDFFPDGDGYRGPTLAMPLPPTAPSA